MSRRPILNLIRVLLARWTGRRVYWRLREDGSWEVL